MEADIFAFELYGELAERAQQEARSYERHERHYRATFGNFSQTAYTGSNVNPPTITDKEKHQKALAKAQEMKAKQAAETNTLGRTFIRDADKANAFSKLSRYETALERSLYKALHELQRLQAARTAKDSVPPPVVIDVDVSGVSQEDL